MSELIKPFIGDPGLNSSEAEISSTNLSLSRQEIIEYLPALVANLSEITGDARNEDPGMMKDKLAKRLPTFNHLILIGTTRNELVAYAGYEEIELINGENLLYENAKMTRRAFQGKGLGTRLTTSAVEAIKPNYVGLRTHNPAEILSAKRALPGTLFAPLDMAFSQDPTLQESLPIIEESLHFKNLDMETGVCKNAYEGRLGDFTVNTFHPDILAIEKRLLELGCLRDNGDAIFIAGKINENH